MSVAPAPPPRRPRLRPRPRARACARASPQLTALPSPWQPDRTLTRRSAHFAREVYSVWCSRVGSVANRLPADQLQVVLNDMQIYPSPTQVCEMLQCAQDCANRTSPSHLTFGEFCVFATELKRSYHRGVPKSSHLARQVERDGKEKKKRSRKMSKSVAAKDEVFLGGSCNPTTWRKDIAIPLLEKLGISYYNPQVEEWSIELVEREHLAKQDASILFYVIDSQTRNVVSMIEAAAFTGSQRRLVLVIRPYQLAQSIQGEPVSPQELKELSGSLLVLRDLVERQGIPVFNNIPVAINCTAKMLRDNVDMQSLVLADLKTPIANGHTHVAEKLLKLREAFNNRDVTGSGHISLADVCMAYRLMTSRKLSVSDLKDHVSGPSDSSDHQIQVNFDEFCAIIAELKNEDKHNNNNNRSSESESRLCSFVTNPILRCIEWSVCSRPSPSPSLANTDLRDVLLAGDSSDYGWANQLAIPVLQRHGLRFHQMAQRGDSAPDLSAADSSFVLLFVVTAQSRSLAVMIMAGHFIGLGCNVVLCVEHIPEEQVVNGEKLTKLAVNDYNRGRIYLKDQARRDNIPIFQTVEEAITCVVEKCQNR